jgi:hypothetical protein
MLLSSIKRRYVGHEGQKGLTNRLIRSKRMLKVRKKRNYEGKIRGHNHHEYPYSLEVSVKRGCSDMLSCILIFHSQIRKRTLYNMQLHIRI